MKKLIGKQSNLDLNKNGKLDSQDFKMLRSKKAYGGTAESSETGTFIGGENASSMYKKGGNLKKKANYVPNYMVQSVEVERKGKTTDIDGANVLDGVYVKKGVKFAKGGDLANMPESFPETDAMSYKNGGGVGDKLPPAKIYGENLGKAIEKFNITESEARKRYGNFTINQWKELLGDKMATGGLTSNWCYSIGGL